MTYLDHMPPWVWKNDGRAKSFSLGLVFFVKVIQSESVNDNRDPMPKPPPEPPDPKIAHLHLHRWWRTLF